MSSRARLLPMGPRARRHGTSKTPGACGRPAVKDRRPTRRRSAQPRPKQGFWPRPPARLLARGEAPRPARGNQCLSNGPRLSTCSRLFHWHHLSSSSRSISTRLRDGAAFLHRPKPTERQGPGAPVSRLPSSRCSTEPGDSDASSWPTLRARIATRYGIFQSCHAAPNRRGVVVLYLPVGKNVQGGTRCPSRFAPTEISALQPRETDRDTKTAGPGVAASRR